MYGLLSATKSLHRGIHAYYSYFRSNWNGIVCHSWFSQTALCPVGENDRTTRWLDHVKCQPPLAATQLGEAADPLTSSFTPADWVYSIIAPDNGPKNALVLS